MLNELGIDLDCADLSNDKNRNSYIFLVKTELFAKDISEIGERHLHTHIINTGQAKPVSPSHIDRLPK